MVRINTVLSEKIIADLDVIAKEEKKNRSMLLREAAERLILEHRRKTAELQRRQRVEKAIARQDELRAKAGAWDGVAEIRKWRERGR